MDCGEPSPSGYIYITASVSTVQGTLWKKGQKSCKSKYKAVYCETVPPRYGCVHKARTTATSNALLINMEILTQRGKFS